MSQIAYPSGTALATPETNAALRQARDDQFDMILKASCIAIGIAIGAGRVAYCHRKRTRKAGES